MSDELNKIKTELDLFASKRGPAVLVAAKVTAINETDSTIEVELDNGATIDDVQLRSVVKAGDKVVVIPKVDSIVLIAAINNSSEFFVVGVEELEKILIVKDGLQVIIAGKIKIEKGADSLKDALVKTIEATEQIVVIYGNNPDYVKLSQALAKINNLLY
jgi:heptaprenylglyceryl phosphate synthase